MLSPRIHPPHIVLSSSLFDYALNLVFEHQVLFIKDPVNIMVYFLDSQPVCGNLLATVFSLNHSGMPVISKEEAVDMDFFTKQIITGRDVHPSIFSNWIKFPD
ncbi:hypothetical protein BGZ49_010559 [Haplosporangium sp. Z 27]|nr:hypothetical protein BGZ49_010559 [Haplosporangium sp. Z 27]